MAINGTRLKVIAGVICGVAIVAGWTWMNRRIETARTNHWGGPNIVGWQISKEYSQRATMALRDVFVKAGRSSRPTSQVRDVLLYYFSEDDLTKDLNWSGIEVRSIRKDSMRYASDPPYKGYMYTISGELRSQQPPILQLEGSKIDLAPMETFNEVYDSAPDAKSRFDVELEDVKGIQQIYGEPMSRKFVAEPSDDARYVSISPPPIFEKDFFMRGKWIGSYAVWDNSSNAASAKVTKMRD